MKKITSAEISMDEASSGGGFTSGGDGGGDTYNPGSDFMNMLGIGSTNESVIIKGQNFVQMKNLADDIKASLNNLSSINSSNIMYRTINRRFIFFLIWIISTK